MMRRTMRILLLAIVSIAACDGSPTEPAAVASVDVSPSSATIVVGEEVEFSVTLRNAQGNELEDREVAWSSSDPSVAGVSADGVATGEAPGNATMRAESEGVAGTAAITVERLPVDAVEITPEGATIIVGDELKLSVAVLDADGRELEERQVSWESSEPGVADVDEDGVVIGLAEGSTTITATSEGESGTAEITVEPAPVASIEVSPSEAEIDFGEELQLEATLRDAEGNELEDREVAWRSSDESVLSVDADGLAVGGGVGRATVTATSEGESGEANIEVVPETGIRVTLEVGTTVRHFAVGFDGGPFGDDVRVEEIPSENGTEARRAFSVPSGGPYRVRAVSWDEGFPTGIGEESGMASGITVSEGELVDVTVTLKAYEVEISAPDEVSGGESVTVAWTYTDPGRAAEDGSATGKPGGFLRYDQEPFSDEGGETEVASGAVVSPGEYEMSATFEAPLEPGTIYFQVQGFTFANIFNAGIGGPHVGFFDPSSARDESLLTIEVK